MAAAVLGSVGLAAAPAATAAGCAASGVSVVVDAGATGGTSTRCVSGDPGSGLAALSSAGYAYTFVPRQPGFVCTIDRAPDPCNGAPASAYWSYWHARPGGSWTYSTLGAGSFDPPAGSVEGWAFGSGAPPRVRPPAASAPRPTPAPTTPAPTTPGATPPRTTPPRPAPPKTTAPGTTAPGTTAPRTTAPQTKAPSPARTTTAPQPTATTRPPVTPAADTPTTNPTPTDNTVVADPASSPGSGSGGLTGPALVGALVLALGGGAALLTWRRRSP